MKFLGLFLSFFLIVLLIANSKSHATNLEGVYKTRCYSIEDDLLSSQIQITKNQFLTQIHAYEEASCQGEYLQIQILQDFQLKGWNLDLTLVSAGYIPRTQEVTRALNLIQWCGFGNWQLNTYQEVTDKVCGERMLFSKGKMLYTILKEEPSKPGFRMGAPTPGHEGKTPQSRHQEWDPVRYE